MSRLRIDLFAFVVLAASLVPTLAEAQTGLLLGLGWSETSEGRPVAPDRYRTLWIAPIGGHMQLVTLGPDIVVPHRDDWLAVGVRPDPSRCVQEVWVMPAGRRPAPAPGQPPAPPCTGGKSWEASAALARLEFVGPEYISVHTYPPEGAGNASWSVMRISESGSSAPPTLDTVAGPKAAAASTRLARKRVLEAFEDAKPDEVLPVSWFVRRLFGRWGLAGLAGWRCPGCPIRYVLVDFSIEPPRTVLGYRQYVPDRPRIEERIHGTDYLVAPDGSLLVALDVLGRLSIFALDKGAVSEPLGEIPIRAGEHVVSAQWATGRHVARWTAELRRVLPR